MRMRLAIWAAVGCGLAWTSLAQADPPVRRLRVVGEAAGAKDPAPARFVIDATIKPGDAQFQSEVTGWFSSIPSDLGTGEITGNCVENHCALSVDISEGKLAISGELAGDGAPGAGHWSLKSDDDDKVVGQGAVSFSAINGPVDQVGALAAADAVSAAELGDLLLWNGSGDGPPDGDDAWPTSDEHEAMAGWQAGSGRSGTGLILVDDLQALRDATQHAKTAAGWTPLGDKQRGWSAGYPATLLPKASRSGAEQRFESADGKALLVIAVEPRLRSDAFDEAFEKAKAEASGKDVQGYTRVNNDYEITIVQNKTITREVYHNREGGLVRLDYSYPEGAETYEPFKDILVHSLVVSDELKPAS